LAQQNGFGPALFAQFVEVGEGIAKAYHLLLIGKQFDWPRWVAISSLPPICIQSFSFMGGVGKKVNN
jgi:hypothetical protein